MGSVMTKAQKRFYFWPVANGAQGMTKNGGKTFFI